MNNCCASSTLARLYILSFLCHYTYWVNLKIPSRFQRMQSNLCKPPSVFYYEKIVDFKVDIMTRGHWVLFGRSMYKKSALAKYVGLKTPSPWRTKQQSAMNCDFYFVTFMAWCLGAFRCLHLHNFAWELWINKVHLQNTAVRCWWPNYATNFCSGSIDRYENYAA